MLVLLPHRNDLAHEPGKYIADPNFDVDRSLFLDAIAILRVLDRFWKQMAIDMGMFEEHGDVDVDDVKSGVLLLLRACLDAWVDGLPDSTADSKDPPGP